MSHTRHTAVPEPTTEDTALWTSRARVLERGERVMPAMGATSHAAGDRIKWKVLYIGGCGRSGSTLLDRMLGQVPGVCSLGELGQLWRALLLNQECGCGQPIQDCPFWWAVGQRAFGGWENVDVAGVGRLAHGVVRQRCVSLMLAPGLWPPYRARLERYEHLMREVYRGVHEVSGAALIVNSTKHYTNALLLERVPDLDFHVLHLMRDPRGVAYSWSKTVEKPEAVHRGRYMNRYTASRSARRWLGYNTCFELLARRGTPVTRVRYEDVVQSPRTELERILRRVGAVDLEERLAFIDGHDVVLGPNHTVAGNPMRFRVGRIPLTVDNAWKARLPIRDQHVVAFVTRPLRRRYGYA